MRVNITGEKDLVLSLLPAFDKVEKQESRTDQTDLKFGIVEVATIVGIVNGVTKLVEFLQARKAKTETGTQRVQVTTALGVVSIELRKDITADELKKHLAKIFK